MKKRGRPRGKIDPKDRRDFAWLNRKLDQAMKKMGITKMATAKEQTEGGMFNGPKRRYD